MKTANLGNMKHGTEHPFISSSGAENRAEIRLITKRCSIEDRLLRPSAMSPLKVERQQVEASEVYQDRMTLQSLHEYRREITAQEEAGYDS